MSNRYEDNDENFGKKMKSGCAVFFIGLIAAITLGITISLNAGVITMLVSGLILYMVSEF